MHHSPTSNSRVRSAAAVSTLLVHALLLLLLLQEDRIERRAALPTRAMVNMWIHLPPPPIPQANREEAAPDPRDRPPVPRPSLPRTAIVLQPSVETPANPSTRETAPVDWYGEAGKLAARAAEDTAPSDGFGEPLQKMRETCEPRDSSFDWNPEEKKYGLLPLPYVMLGQRCVIGLGFFGCTLSALPEPNKHLFDDMEAGRTPDSSVPHPNYCD